VVGARRIRYTWGVLEIVVTHLSGSRRNAVETFGNLPVKLGRADDNDVKFDAEQDIKVSAHHAEVRSDGEGGLQVVDLSKNGVLVNGAKIDGTAPLPNHAVLELGTDGPRLKVRFESAGSRGISFSKLKKASPSAEAGGAEQPPQNKHLRTTAEAVAYTEADLDDKPPRPPGPGSRVALMFALVALVIAAAAVTVVSLL
jgi:predicted component of type VI protein secretion system